MLFRLNTAFFLVCFLASTVSLQTQNTPSKTDGELIALTVTVKSKSGNLITGVPRDSFQLFDDKEPQTIESFENSDSPMSIEFLVDISNSMQFYEYKDIARAAAIDEALSHFVKSSNPKSEFLVLAFDSAPRALTGWKEASDLLSNKITLSLEKRNTALFDSILLGLNTFESAHYKKRAMVVFTDGLDNSSKTTFGQLRNQLRKSDVTVYAIGVRPPENVGTELVVEGDAILKEFVSITGGEAMFPVDKKQMASAIETIALEFRNQYRLGFREGKSRPGWHKLKIIITPKPNASSEFRSLIATTRQAYYVN